MRIVEGRRADEKKKVVVWCGVVWCGVVWCGGSCVVGDCVKELQIFVEFFFFCLPFKFHLNYYVAEL